MPLQNEREIFSLQLHYTNIFISRLEVRLPDHLLTKERSINSKHRTAKESRKAWRDNLQSFKSQSILVQIIKHQRINQRKERKQ